jgi:proline racemase
MEQVEYPDVGTNTICVTTVLLETGMLPAKELYRADSSHPRLIEVRADCATA